jgi:hypothetical protein
MKKMKTSTSKKPKKKIVKFVFDNERAAEHFISWLCESGEQSYWQWMDYRETEEDGNITVLDFDYWGRTKSGKNFGKSDIICSCGRLDEDKCPTEDENDIEYPLDDDAND